MQWRDGCLTTASMLDPEGEGMRQTKRDLWQLICDIHTYMRPAPRRNPVVYEFKTGESISIESLMELKELETMLGARIAEDTGVITRRIDQRLLDPDSVADNLELWEFLADELPGAPEGDKGDAIDLITRDEFDDPILTNVRGERFAVARDGTLRRITGDEKQ